MRIRRWDEEEWQEMIPGVRRQLLTGERLTVARLRFDAGAVVPRHAHDNEQATNVLEGRMRFDVDGDVVEVAAGESVLLPGGVPHETTALEPSFVIEVFAPRREEWVTADDPAPAA